MAISPKQANEAFTADHKAIINEAEVSIDEMLAENRRTYSVKGLPEPVVAAIIGMYSRVGWKVKVVDDQREGDYLQFAEPTMRKS